MLLHPTRSPMDKSNENVVGFNPIPKELEEDLIDAKLMEKKSGDEAPMVTDYEVARFPDTFNLDRSLMIRAPKPEERLDWGSKNWTTMLTDFIRIYPLFPLPPLVLELCNFYDLAPSQLMPAVWYVMLSLEELAKKLAIKISLPDVLSCYSFGRKANGLFTLTKNSAKHLVIIPDDSARLWKRRFVVVHKSCLVSTGQDVRTEWHNLCKHTVFIHICYLFILFKFDMY